MVSLAQRQELASVVVHDPQLQRFQLLLDGAKIAIGGSGELGIREQLLEAIAVSDGVSFCRIADGIGQRRIGHDSDWCQDDYLIFLLLLGQEKFDHRLCYLQSVIEVRMANVNPTPRKINEVFVAIARQEFGISGEFGFLKIPFLHLIGKLHIGPSEAKKALSTLSTPGLLEDLPPFFRLLTQKAYDLVLTDRQPNIIETTGQLVEKLETHAKEFSLHDWGKILLSLPGHLLWGMGALIAGLGLIPVLFGVGKGFFDEHLNIINRHRPTVLTVAALHAPGPDFSPEGTVLAKSLQQPTASPEHKSLVVVVEIIPFASATPSFVVEAAHLDHPIRAAFAFTKVESRGDRSFTIVPVAKDGGRFRAMVPEKEAGTTFCFVLEFEVNGADTVEAMARRLLLRPLD